MIRYTKESAAKRGVAVARAKAHLVISVLILFLSTTVVYSSVLPNEINNRTKIYLQQVSADSLVLKINNTFSVPISLKLVPALKNLEGSGRSEILAVVPAKASAFDLGSFKKTTVGAPFEFSYSWKIVLGDVSKTPDSSFSYSLPFEQGSFPVSQGPGGDFSHKDLFAYDFVMPAGTPVFASRDGIVASVKSDSDRGGASKEFIDDANYISLYHTDGTLAYYFHLQRDGVVVQEGQAAKQGDLIGYSGNTGFSNGAHLHFEVVQPDLNSEKNKTIAFNWTPSTRSVYGTEKQKIIDKLHPVRALEKAKG